MYDNEYKMQNVYCIKNKGTYKNLLIWYRIELLEKFIKY